MMLRQALTMRRRRFLAGIGLVGAPALARARSLGVGAKLPALAALPGDGPTAPADAPTGRNDQYFPSDANFFNVRSYGATGDGVSDDTAAIQSAIHAALNGTRASAGRTILFPAATNLVSQAIRWINDASPGGTTWSSGIGLQGSGPATIKLADRLRDYQDPANPKPLLWVASQPWQSANTNGQGNNAFYNYIFDLVLDVGAGNPGAVGVAWIGNNISGVENVVIKSSDPHFLGHAGITDYLNRYAPGPSLFKNVLVRGFSHGVVWNNQDYSVVFDGLTLVDQTEDQIVDGDQPMSVRRLTAPRRTIRTSGGGLLVLADLPQSVWTLPVQDMPSPAIISSSRASDYINVVSRGADPTGAADSTAAIQAAIDSGHPVVYFPYGTYLLTGTIFIRGSVRRLMGCGSTLNPKLSSFIQAFTTTADFSARLAGFDESGWGGTWNPNDNAGGQVALSDGNLSASSTGTYSAIASRRSVRSVVGYSSGKHIFRTSLGFTCNDNGIRAVTFGLAGAASGGNLGWTGKDSVVYVPNYSSQGPVKGAIQINSSVIATVEGALPGDTVDVAFDFDKQLLWVRRNGPYAARQWNGSPGADPVLGTGGISVGLNPGTTYYAAWCSLPATTAPYAAVIQFSGAVDCQIDRFTLNAGPSGVCIQHNSPAQLSLKHLAVGAGARYAQGSYNNTTSATGNLFIEDCDSGGAMPLQGCDWLFNGQNVWARQLNPETWFSTKIVNNGGRLWILGLKTEGPGTVIKTTRRGRTEVLGGLLYPLAADSANPAFLHTDEATGSYAFRTSAYRPGVDYTTFLETPTKKILKSQVQPFGYGSIAAPGVVFG